MKCYTIVVGELETRCYLVWDEQTRNAVLIDPGDDPERLLEALQKERLTLKKILLTHGHFDHTGAVMALYQVTGAQVWIHRADLELENPFGGTLALPEEVQCYDEGDVVEQDSLAFRVLHTPGHTPGSVCLLCEEGNLIFSGDTLFQGSCGRTDFPGGSWEQMCASLKRLYALPGDVQVLSGHTPASWLSIERAQNPYLRGAVQL